MPAIDTLEAISPIDGRYRRITKPLADYFSEKALIKYRIMAEGEYLILLSKNGNTRCRKLTDDETGLVRALYNPSVEDAQIVKDIETKGYKGIPATNHDVKAVEYYMKDKLKGTSLEDCLEWVHFALTSEDTNNVAYALMISDAVANVLLPSMKNVYNAIHAFATKYEKVPILARTHGQPASPTTFGKEFMVFSSRLKRQIEAFENLDLMVKLNGATGNYNAHYAAYPRSDWIMFSQAFVSSFNAERKIKFKTNLITTQIEPHDTYAEMFDNLSRLNTILIDFDQDMWRYISDDWIKQKPKEGEVGSSTMPHKVNPIDFENSEGNLMLANALLGMFSRTLPISRLQRHLTDSTIERNFGSAFAYSLIGYENCIKGMGKVDVNEVKVRQVLDEHPEVISEAIQTILRREGVEMPYEKLKDMTRGKKVTLEDLRQFALSLNISDTVKVEIMKITPQNYTGLASELVQI
jgi:adenylosuccinate lyase